MMSIPENRDDVGQFIGTFGQYLRRLDGFDYRGKRHDVPHDIVELLELSREIEFSDKIIFDVKDYGD